MVANPGGRVARTQAEAARDKDETWGGLLEELVMPVRTLCRCSLVFALGLFAYALGCSSSGGSSSGGQSLTCQGGTGPESQACDQCGQTNCASQHAALISNCAMMVSCIEACHCDTTDTCLHGCINAANSNCQSMINAYADCEKMASACTAACTQ